MRARARVLEVPRNWRRLEKGAVATAESGGGDNENAIFRMAPLAAAHWPPLQHVQRVGTTTVVVVVVVIDERASRRP